MANSKARASNQTADRDGGHVLNLSICCCEETTLGGSKPRMPRRSLSVIENAVPCSNQPVASEVQNPPKKRDRVKSGSTAAAAAAAASTRTERSGDEAYPVEPGVVEDVGPALVEDDGAVALRRHVLPRVL